MKIVDKISFSKISDPIRGKDQLRGMGPGYDRSLVSLQATDGRDWKTLIGPESVTSLTGQQYDEDGNPVGSGSPYQPYVSPTKGLRESGAWTNLFTNVTPTAETKSLTAQKYCLQVFGTGASATCSYGTATDGNPLFFTATAGSTTFTPTSCAKWQLVADGGYVRDYVPPGITNSASSSTTGGGGTNTPLSDDMLECLRGKVGGVELWSNITTQTVNANNYSTYDTVTGISRIVSNGTFVNLLTPSGATTSGNRYLIRVLSLSGTGVIKATISTVTVDIPLTSGGVYEVFSNAPYIQIARATACDITFKLSIQRLLPSIFTSVAAVWVGAGSGELPVNTNHNIISPNSLAYSIYSNHRVDGTKSPINAFDGTTFIGFDNSSWNRDEIHLKVVQTNAAGTQFRVGNRRYTSAMVPIDALTWGSWAAYDGSMNPLTHLRLALNGTIPLWFKLVSLSNKSLSDTEILKQLRYSK